MDDDIFPIQIREDLVVRFAHIPNDLTQGEADKICRVIQALVKDDSSSLHPKPSTKQYGEASNVT